MYLNKKYCIAIVIVQTSCPAPQLLSVTPCNLASSSLLKKKKFSALHTRFLAHRLATVTRLWRGTSEATLHTRPKRGLLLQPSPLLFAHVFETMLPTCFFFQNCLKSRARNCAFRSELLLRTSPDVFLPSGTCTSRIGLKTWR